MKMMRFVGLAAFAALLASTVSFAQDAAKPAAPAQQEKAAAPQKEGKGKKMCAECAAFHKQMTEDKAAHKKQMAADKEAFLVTLKGKTPEEMKAAKAEFKKQQETAKAEFKKAQEAKKEEFKKNHQCTCKAGAKKAKAGEEKPATEQK